MGKHAVVRLHVLLALGLAALTFAAFCGVLSNDFVSYDDGKYVTENPHLRGGLNTDTVVWAFTAYRASNWHPLTWLSHALDVQLYAMNPLGHHLTSLLLHTANVVLLYWLLFRMTTSHWKSAFVAALFAVHPLHVESVAWVAERKDVLSTFFWMLTMLAYVRYAESPSIGRYLPVILLFGIGLLAKPMLVTLPLMLLVLDYWPLKRLPIRTQLLEKLPLFGLSAASCVVTFVAQRAGGSVADLGGFTLVERIGNALVSYVAYISKALWPSKLACFYPHPGSGLPAWQPILAAVGLIGFTGIVIKLSVRRPYLLAGWLWYLVTLIPVIGFVQVGFQAMADRYTYIPLIGVFVMIAWGIPESMGVREYEGMSVRKRPPARGRPLRHSETRIPTPSHTPLAAMAAFVIAILAWRTSVEVHYWHDEITLFERALAVTHGNYVAHNNLGRALADQRRFDEAIIQYRAGIETDPDPGLTYSNLGVAYAETGRFDDAMDCFRRSVESDPRCAEGHTNLARGLAMQGKFDEAMKHLSTARELDPESPNVYLEIGEVLGMQRRMAEAIPELLEAIRLKPDLAPAHLNLAVAYYDKGEYRLAWHEVHLAQQLGLSPQPSFQAALTRQMPEPTQ